MIMDSMTFEEFCDKNESRCRRWHPDPNDWSLSDWYVALAGEIGEGANIVKKMNRITSGVTGNRDPATLASLKKKLGEELADSLIYVFLVAYKADIDLELALIEKFNVVSEALGFPEFIGPHNWREILKNEAQGRSGVTGGQSLDVIGDKAIAEKIASGRFPGDRLPGPGSHLRSGGD